MAEVRQNSTTVAALQKRIYSPSLADHFMGGRETVPSEWDPFGNDQHYSELREKVRAKLCPDAKSDDTGAEPYTTPKRDGCAYYANNLPRVDEGEVRASKLRELFECLEIRSKDPTGTP